MNKLQFWAGALGSCLGTLAENANFFVKLNYEQISCTKLVLYHFIDILKVSEYLNLLKEKYE